MDSVRNRLSELKIEDLNLRGNHLLLSLDTKGTLILNDQGVPEVRICSFELLKIKR